MILNYADNSPDSTRLRSAWLSNISTKTVSSTET